MKYTSSEKQLIRIVVFTLFVVCGCNWQEHGEEVSNEVDSVRIASPWVQNIISSYCPLDTSFVISDNNYLFSVDSRWDTSFTLILKRESGKVKGVYYEVAPDDDLSVSYGAKLFAFGGFSFETDTLTWKRILDRSADLMTAPYNDDDRCADCAAFTIAYNYQTNFSDRKSRESFKKHALFLKDSLIAPLKKFKR